MFGVSVALSGDTAVVGAFLSDVRNFGAAYVFRYDGTAWVQEAKLTASAAADDAFGVSVALAATDHPAEAGCGKGYGPRHRPALPRRQRQ